jgi:hypothetical protein
MSKRKVLYKGKSMDVFELLLSFMKINKIPVYKALLKLNIGRCEFLKKLTEKEQRKLLEYRLLYLTKDIYCTQKIKDQVNNTNYEKIHQHK